MLVRRHVHALLGSALIALALPSAALAADSGYQSITWISGTDAGDIQFTLADSDTVYYKCTDADLVEHCRAILLTALSTAREVKAYWTLGSGTSSSPYLVTTVRIH